MSSQAKNMSIASYIILGVMIVMYFVKFSVNGVSDQTSDFANFGSYFSSIFSLITILILIRTLANQIQTNFDVKEKSNQNLKLQNENLKLQKENLNTQLLLNKQGHLRNIIYSLRDETLLLMNEKVYASEIYDAFIESNAISNLSLEEFTIKLNSSSDLKVIQALNTIESKINQDYHLLDSLIQNRTRNYYFKLKNIGANLNNLAILLCKYSSLTCDLIEVSMITSSYMQMIETLYRLKLINALSYKYYLEINNYSTIIPINEIETNLDNFIDVQFWINETFNESEFTREEVDLSKIITQNGKGQIAFIVKSSGEEGNIEFDLPQID
jgi:hypothetical protein